MSILVTFLIGVVAGLRTMAAPAAVALAAWLGWIDLEGTWASFMASPWAAGILAVLAIGELVTDQLPSTPSRKVPVQFGARLVSGAFSGGALAASAAATPIGLIAGIVGAVVGTYLGANARAQMARAFGGDPPAALIEDAFAIIGGLLVAAAL
jgi:uncharacterized membrane protein